MTNEEAIPVIKAKPDEFQWATRIETRTPKFKAHRTLGHAKAAIKSKFMTYSRGKAECDMVMYRRQEDTWVPIHSWKYGDPVESVPWLPKPPSKEEVDRKKRVQEVEAGVNRIKIQFSTLPNEIRNSLLWDIDTFFIKAKNALYGQI